MSLEVRYSVSDDFDAVFALLSQLWPEKSSIEDAMHEAFTFGISAESEIYLSLLDGARIVGVFQKGFGVGCRLAAGPAGEAA